ncbi:hypothetical protein EHS25_000961 [Saitozyma podzolica]|uniref:Uncharacterized protein n=1 Tax=Saitozyma podzolica TaxID=1890683 RepID=A0A427YXQ3_9TREE|nr:hypothetical protein EHS25_000961 [Saitozyma podzolica]
MSPAHAKVKITQVLIRMVEVVPEVDVLEAGADLSVPVGQMSQSAQVAPFDAEYQVVNTSNAVVLYNTTNTKFNSYKGGQYQQAISAFTNVDSSVYQLTSGSCAVYIS